MTTTQKEKEEPRLLSREVAQFIGRRERFQHDGEEDRHIQCADCHRVLKGGEYYHRFIVSYPYMISGDWCETCAAKLMEIVRVKSAAT